jgi:exopolysaccharide biosynthesis polyprenyl glycosylphosphotransferase
VTRTFAQHVPIEMALLGLFELTLSYLLIYAMLSTPGANATLAASPLLTRGTANIAAMLALTIGGTAATIGLYRPEVCLDRKRLLINATVAGLLAFPAVALVSGGFHLSLSGSHAIWLAKLLAIWLGGMLLLRLAFNLVLRRSRLARRILIIGSTHSATLMTKTLRACRFRLFEPVLLGADVSALSPDRLREQRIWGVVIAAGAATQQYSASLLDSKLRGIRIFDETTFHETQLGRIDIGLISRSWLLCADGFAAGPLSTTVKRAGDILISCGLLLLTMPLMLITALLIKCDSPGPVLYRQQRTGRFGRPFTLFKFRSMTVDAETGGDPRWAQQHDPRVTRVGSFIRPMRIDELPQLFNVLRGEMSVVGPRPERPHFVEQLVRVVPFYHERSYVAPGITGWAQVNFPYGASVEDAREKLAYDLYYVKNRNLLLDLLILFATVRVILFREGAR